MSRFFITTPIYYANAPLHLGHAYTSIACDVLARWHRLKGDEVFLLTGLDEHGGNIEKVAKEAGIEPQAWCDRIAVDDRKFIDTLGISYDDFIRTTEDRHRTATESFWKIVAGAKTPKGQDCIYKGTYTGLYCSPCEAYYAEPDLVEGNCPVHHRPVEKLEEETYFFRLSDYQEFLTKYFDDHSGFISPNTRFNEVRGFLLEGLRDISITRTKVGWGFPVPGDPAHVIYVWFDALINYLTALGYPDPAAKLWPHWSQGPVMHVMAKEIIRFHCLLWPAMLHAAGLRIMDRIAVHGFWTSEGQKISKTTGNTIDPLAYVERYGVDAFRHFVLAEITFGADGDFSEKRFIERYNTDLANIFGNLAHRTIAMSHKYFAGKVPLPKDKMPLVQWVNFAQTQGLGDPPRSDRGTLAEDVMDWLEQPMNDPQPQAAIERIWALVRAGNKYIDDRTPWNQPDEHRAHTLGHVVVLLEAVSWPLRAFMPETAAKLRQRLGLPVDKRIPLPAEFNVIAGDPLFPRVDTKKKS